MKKEIARLKEAHLGMAQFLETKSLLKMIKNAFYFTLKGLFVLIISKILSLFFVHEEKQVHQKDKINFEIDDIATWLTNS